MSILRRSDPEPLEFFLGLLSCVWGVFLLIPGNSWDSNPAYDLIREALRWEQLAGLLWCAQGGLQLHMPRESHRPCLRAVLALWGASQWFLILASIAVARPLSTGTPVYSVLTLSSIWVIYRLGYIEVRVRGNQC